MDLATLTIKELEKKFKATKLKTENKAQFIKRLEGSVEGDQGKYDELLSDLVQKGLKASVNGNQYTFKYMNRVTTGNINQPDHAIRRDAENLFKR